MPTDDAELEALAGMHREIQRMARLLTTRAPAALKIRVATSVGSLAERAVGKSLAMLRQRAAAKQHDEELV